MDFKAFMQENVLPVENKKVVVSKRFLENGKPVEWEIRALTSTEDDELRKTCTKLKPAPGKAGNRGQMVPTLDSTKYMNTLVATCVVYPDLENAALQDSWKVKSPVALLQKMLTPGELSELAFEVQTLCGFDVTLDDKVEQAKN